MATRKGKRRTRRGRNDVWRALYGVDTRRRKRSLAEQEFAAQGTPFALAAGVFGEIELVIKDLSLLDRICPRSTARFPLVPEPERPPVFR